MPTPRLSFRGPEGRERWRANRVSTLFILSIELDQHPPLTLRVCQSSTPKRLPMRSFRRPSFQGETLGSLWVQVATSIKERNGLN